MTRRSLAGVDYLLDTDICIYLIKKRPSQVLVRMRQCGLERIAISSITVSELEYGMCKSQSPTSSRAALIEFLVGMELLEFSVGDAQHFGEIRAHLESKGVPIGPYDLQIAAQAVSRGLILVTNNEREFRRVPGIKVENWLTV